MSGFFKNMINVCFKIILYVTITTSFCNWEVTSICFDDNIKISLFKHYLKCNLMHVNKWMTCEWGMKKVLLWKLYIKHNNIVFVLCNVIFYQRKGNEFADKLLTKKYGYIKIKRNTPCTASFTFLPVSLYLK